MKVAIVLKMIYYIAHMYMQQCVETDLDACTYIFNIFPIELG